jgi:glucose-1-phosphate thymidylyltransferase
MKKGILLAGGFGTRMYPLTIAVSKQLLPIFDKPMIFYSLSILMYSNIREILIITNPENVHLYKKLFSNGNNFGLNISYAAQKKPIGIANAMVVGKNFLGKDDFALVLGDNIIFSRDNTLHDILKNSFKKNFATLFVKKVKDPNRYGVVKYNSSSEVDRIIEKPKKYTSKDAVVGVYFYPNEAIRISQNLLLSKRGEFEITDINNYFIKKKNYFIKKLPAEVFWEDCGTIESYRNTFNKIYSLQKIYKKIINSPNLIAFKNKWINKKKFIENKKNNLC